MEHLRCKQKSQIIVLLSQHNHFTDTQAVIFVILMKLWVLQAISNFIHNGHHQKLGKSMGDGCETWVAGYIFKFRQGTCVLIPLLITSPSLTKTYSQPWAGWAATDPWKMCSNMKDHHKQGRAICFFFNLVSPTFKCLGYCLQHYMRWQLRKSLSVQA